MKVDQSAFNSIIKPYNRGPAPPIPFEKVERAAPTKTDCTEFKLYTNPDDSNSQTYTVEVRHFKTGPPESWLETLNDIERIIKGS